MIFNGFQHVLGFELIELCVIVCHMHIYILTYEAISAQGCRQIPQREYARQDFLVCACLHTWLEMKRKWPAGTVHFSYSSKPIDLDEDNGTSSKPTEIDEQWSGASRATQQQSEDSETQLFCFTDHDRYVTMSHHVFPSF